MEQKKAESLCSIESLLVIVVPDNMVGTRIANARKALGWSLSPKC